MNQLLSTFGINGWLLLAQAINFSVLLAVLWYFLYRPILRIIDARRAKIAESVRIAAEADHKLEDAKVQGEKMVGEAAREAEGLVATARARAEEKGGEIVKAAQGRADVLMEEAKARADELKRQALAESEKEIARASMLAAEKILRQRNA